MIEKPEKIAALPVDERGFPIPWNVQLDTEGKPIFTVNDHAKHLQAIRDDLCPLCGNKNENVRWFVGGPNSAFHPRGVYFDLPGHVECIEYALQVCPYLAAKNYRHRIDLPDSRKLPDSVVALVDYTQDPNRPEIFVMVAALGTEVLLNNNTVYVRPTKPVVGYQYWRKGIKLSNEEGEQWAKRNSLQAI